MTQPVELDKKGRAELLNRLVDKYSQDDRLRVHIIKSVTLDMCEYSIQEKIRDWAWKSINAETRDMWLTKNIRQQYSKILQETKLANYLHTQKIENHPGDAKWFKKMKLTIASSCRCVYSKLPTKIEINIIHNNKNESEE